MKYTRKNRPKEDAAYVARCKGCKWYGMWGCADNIVEPSRIDLENDYCPWWERENDNGDTD